MIIDDSGCVEPLPQPAQPGPIGALAEGLTFTEPGGIFGSSSSSSFFLETDRRLKACEVPPSDPSDC